MPDGPDEYLPGLEPDEPTVEEATDTPADIPEPSEVPPSADSSEGQGSRHQRDSYDIRPNEYPGVLPLRLHKAPWDEPGWIEEDDDRNDMDPIDLLAAGLPRRVDKDGVPYSKVVPEDHFSSKTVGQSTKPPLVWARWRALRKPVAVVGAATLGAILIAVLFSMLSQDDVSELAAVSAANNSDAAQAPESADAGADDPPTNVESAEESQAGSDAAQPEASLLELDEVVPYDCPEGHQPDTTWDPPTDGKGNLLEPEPESDRDRASDIGCTQEYWGSYVFVMTVKGDGESLSKEQYTVYDVSFTVNNEWPNNVYYDDTGFAVNVSWQHLSQAYAWQVFDSDRSLVKGGSVDIEWLDESTLQVIVDLPGDQVEVVEVRTELDVYISDADDNHVYDHRDVAIWTAEQ